MEQVDARGDVVEEAAKRCVIERLLEPDLGQLVAENRQLGPQAAVVDAGHREGVGDAAHRFPAQEQAHERYPVLEPGDEAARQQGERHERDQQHVRSRDHAVPERFEADHRRVGDGGRQHEAQAHGSIALVNG